MAVQEAVFTRAGIERVGAYAVDLAQRRQGRLISATRSHGIIQTMPFWDEVVGECVAANPGVTVENVLMLTRTLAAELEGTGILVNAASPAYTRTDMSPDADRLVRDGADTPVWLATLPDTGPTEDSSSTARPMPGEIGVTAVPVLPSASSTAGPAPAFAAGSLRVVADARAV